MDEINYYHSVVTQTSGIALSLDFIFPSDQILISPCPQLLLKVHTV